jgi:hypothetical protein
MASSGMLHRVALVRTDVSEELSASFIRVTRIGELGTTLHQLLVKDPFVLSPPILVTLLMEALCSSEKSVLTRVTRRNIPEDAILHTNVFLLPFLTLSKFQQSNCCQQRRRNCRCKRKAFSTGHPDKVRCAQ